MTSRFRVLLALTVLLAIAGAGWLANTFFGAPKFEPLLRRNAIERGADADAAEALLATARAEAPAAARESFDDGGGDASDDEAAASGVGAAAELPLEPATGDGIEITILAPDRTPVADATLVWATTRNAAPTTYAALADRDALAILGARRFRSDSDGRCRLPRSLDSAIVFAFAPTGRGALQIEPTVFFPIELMLAPRFGVVVRATTAEGDGPPAPLVGMEVGWSRTNETAYLANIVARTDGVGEARFDDLDLLLLPMRKPIASAEGTASPHEPSEWRVAIRGVAAGEAAATVRLPPPIAEGSDGSSNSSSDAPTVVELRLPAHGTLVLTVLDKEGVPVSDGELSITARGPAGARLDATLPLAPDGTLTIDPVELGWSARIEARAPRFDFLRRDIVGPQRGGESVTIELRLPPARQLIRGRAVDADGGALAHRDLLIDSQRSGALTADDGQFEFDAARFDRSRQRNRERRNRGRESGAPAAAAELLRVMLGLEPSVKSEPHDDALVEFALPDRGVLDLGDVRFEARPFACAGRVVDESGAPIEGASVTAFGTIPDGWRTDTDDDGDRQTSAMSFTDEAGQFALWCHFDQPTLRLVAHRSGLIPAVPFEVTVGTRDLEIVLARGGGCEASLRNDGPLAPGWFVAQMVAERDGRVANATPNREGGLRFALLAAGRYDFVLLFANDRSRRELARIGGIEIVPFTLNQDPRLQAIDPALWIATTEVHALRPDGSPQLDGRIVLGPEPRRTRGQLRLTDGKSTFPFFGESTTVTVQAPGFQIATASQRPGRIDLPLEAAPVVTLQLDGFGERDDGLVPGEFELRPHLELLKQIDWRGRAKLVDNVATIELPAFCKYDLELQLFARGTDGEWRPARDQRHVKAGTIELKRDGQREFKVRAKG